MAPSSVTSEDHNHDAQRPRHHRLQSVVLTDDQLVEIRAAQRTFEGAYIRTSLGLFSFSLVVLRIFTAEFYGVGALFAVYGMAVLLLAAYRRRHGNRQFYLEVDHDGTSARKFRTSGNVVVFMTVLSVGAYIALMVIISTLTK